jgi:hypothetical protein
VPRTQRSVEPLRNGALQSRGPGYSRLEETGVPGLRSSASQELRAASRPGHEKECWVPRTQRSVEPLRNGALQSRGPGYSRLEETGVPGLRSCASQELRAASRPGHEKECCVPRTQRSVEPLRNGALQSRGPGYARLEETGVPGLRSSASQELRAASRPGHEIATNI